MINRTNIEDRDQRLIKKFRKIIEEKKPLGQQVPPKRPWSVFALAGLIIMISIMFMIFYMMPERVPTAPSPTPKKIETASPENPASIAQHTFADVEKPDIPNEKPAQALPSETAPVLPAAEVTPPSEVVQGPQAAPMKTLPQIVSDTDVTISELVICRNIKDRMYISAGNRFSMSKGAKPVVWTWMNVLTEKPPQTLSHIYYLNGERYCQVILPIPYPRTRTWSNVTLNRPGLAGSWRVDVVNSSGQVIASADFIVEI